MHTSMRNYNFCYNYNFAFYEQGYLIYHFIKTFEIFNIKQKPK